MIVNGENLRAAARGFRTLFVDALGKAQPMYQELATEVPSTNSEENYAWLEALPRVREWLGDRVVHNLKGAGYSIRNRKFECTIGVKREEIEDDALGIVRPRIEMMAADMAMHPDDLLDELLKGAFTATCFDGQYFIDTDHPVGGVGDQAVASVSNKGTGVLTPDNYGLARAGMIGLTDASGRPVRVNPGILAVPPQLEGAARRIVEGELIEGETNIWKGTATVKVLPGLAGHPTWWFLFDASKPIKPFIVQIREKPEFTALDRPDDEAAFMRDEFLFGTRARHTAGYGLWQLAFGSTGGA